MLSTKAIWQRPAPVLAYRFTESGRIEWEDGAVDGVDANMVFGVSASNGGESPTDVEAFLRDVLSDGPVPAKEIEREARGQDISRSTLHRMKRRLGIMTERVGFGKGGEWQWSLPPTIGTQPRPQAEDLCENPNNFIIGTHANAGSEDLCSREERLDVEHFDKF